MLGLAVDPGYATGRPYVYVLYTYNHVLGDPEDAAHTPRWPSADSAVPPGSPTDDRCPSPPAATTDGCVVSGRLSRLTSVGGVMSGPEDVLIEDWCQQFPSHSIGGLMFGPDGALYRRPATARTSTRRITASPAGRRGARRRLPIRAAIRPARRARHSTPPTAEGGTLRSQDLRTAGDPVGLDGTIMRVDPDTGAGLADQRQHRRLPTPTPAGSSPTACATRSASRSGPAATARPGCLARRRRIVHVGGDRPPARTRTRRRATSAGRAGRAIRPLPTYPGPGTLDLHRAAGGEVTTPYYTYRHPDPVVTGDGCAIGSSSISGMTFLSSTSGYPDAYDGALFFTDYTRRCIWVMPAGAGGLPDVNAGPGSRSSTGPTRRLDGGAVFLTIAPSGDLVYADYDRGEIRRIHYYGSTPPVASFTATPSIGPAPLHVAFDAAASTRCPRRSVDLRLGPRWRRPVRRRDRRDGDTDVPGPAATSPSASRSRTWTSMSDTDEHDDLGGQLRRRR